MDRDHKRELLRALADQGRASGMEAAAEVILEIAKSHTRVVGTNTLRDVAAALKEKAKATRESAGAVIAHLGQSTAL